MTGDTDRGRLRVEEGHKRVRALLGGAVAADTTRPLLVWEVPYYPTYYVPAADVRAVLEPTGARRRSPSRGDAVVLDVRSGTTVAPGGALQYRESPIEALRDAVRFDWDAMDEWLEEDEPVYRHARDPYTRVDILASSRHVVVGLGGVVLAESRQPRILFETGLPPRFYLPMTDVAIGLLEPSPTVTHCPYKGAATYWSVRVGDTVHEDFAWCYRAPVPESQKVAGLVCFYNERVDLTVDGVTRDRPHTTFS